MKNKILKEEDIIKEEVEEEEIVEEVEEEEELDTRFDEEEEIPAVGVSTFLKKEEPKEEPKSDLETIKDDIDKLRESINGGMNIHRIWVKLGEIQDKLKKLV